MKNSIVVTGGSSGLGAEIVKVLAQRNYKKIYNLSHFASEDKKVENWSEFLMCDVADFVFCKGAAELTKNVKILINNAGVNYIEWIDELTSQEWDFVMNTNAKGIFNTTRAFLPQLLKNRGIIVNIVSNASHVPMTNSIAYNASKGAAHIMTLQMARELGPKGITVFGISPNKLKGTNMSNYIDERVCELRGWSKEQAHEYQIAALPAGEETPPGNVARFLDYLLCSPEKHYKYLAGTVLPYGK